MRILITGGAGFIGQYVARALSEENAVTALDNLLPQVHLDREASRDRFPGPLVEGDVSDAATWAGLAPHDLIIHLAAETGTGQSMYEQDRYRKVNVEGTRLAGLAAQRWSAPLVALSSRAVYGQGPVQCPRHGLSYDGKCCDQGLPVASAEHDPHVPVSFYGTTKSEGEDVLLDVAPHVPVTILRPQNVVGPGQALHNPYTGVLAAFLARLREGLPLVVYGDGSATRDFVHVQDLAAVIFWCARQPPSTGTPRVLNVGTGVRTSLLELADAAIEGSPLPPLPVERLPVHRAGDIEHACADLSRLQAVGAPLPRWTSREAISDFIRQSWTEPGASSHAWDGALAELRDRGLTT